MSQIRNDKTIEKKTYSTPIEKQPLPQYSLDSPDIVAAFSNLNLGSERTKLSQDQCIAHLKLLEAFHQLREDVATTDGLFGIKDSLVPESASEALRAELLLKIREKRWAVYVVKAVSRFETWWKTSVEPGGLMLRQSEINQRFPYVINGDGEKDQLTFTAENLPPLGELSIFWRSGS